MAGSTILIVEDDKAIRDLVQQVLELDGFRCLTATNGREALEILAREEVNKPRLILLDLMMPVMDGIEFLKHQSENVAFASIPVVVVSAFVDQATSVKAAEFLEKPFQFDRLLSLVRKYCA